ncbi:hypothetical protein [Helicobacter sp.]|uniref:hypothetical protein n=1 Tax=Helicobacter sp. TaxID=218 RepID=UPI0025C58FD1|nr:hypothetical protein [Helicobacter sp.]MCI5968587.1 hypothetical protein [Helicobacter sp.]
MSNIELSGLKAKNARAQEHNTHELEKNNGLKETFNAQIAKNSAISASMQTLNVAIAAQNNLNLKNLYDSKKMQLEYLFANALLQHTQLNAQILKCVKLISIPHRDKIPLLEAKKHALEADIYRLNQEIIAQYAEILELKKVINALEASIKELREESASLLEEIAFLESRREYLQDICAAENEKLVKIKESLEIKKASVNQILEKISIKRALIKESQAKKIELNNLLYQGIGQIKLLEGKLELINTDLERTKQQTKESEKWKLELM